MTYRLHFGGRYYAETDLRWVGQSTNYGTTTENISQNYGTALDPNPHNEAQGELVRAGWKITKIDTRVDRNSDEIIAVNMALVHQDASGVETVLWRDLNLALTSTARLNQLFRDVDITIPSDGVLFFAMQPVGVLTARRYMPASVFVYVQDQSESGPFKLEDRTDKWGVVLCDGDAELATVYEIDKTITSGKSETLNILRDER